ncbi:hypothetical protein ACWKX9_25555, partial [Enterobacter asburiae]
GRVASVPVPGGLIIFRYGVSACCHSRRCAEPGGRDPGRRPGRTRQMGEHRDGDSASMRSDKGCPGEELMADLGEVVSRQAGSFQH